MIAHGFKCTWIRLRMNMTARMYPYTHTHTHTLMHIATWHKTDGAISTNMNISMYVYTHTHVCTHAHTHTHTHKNTHARAHTHNHVAHDNRCYAKEYECWYVSVHTHTHKHTHTHTNTHKHTHTHTHKHTHTHTATWHTTQGSGLPSTLTRRHTTAVKAQSAAHGPPHGLRMTLTASPSGMCAPPPGICRARSTALLPHGPYIFIYICL